MEPRFEAVASDEDSSFRCLHFACEHFANDHAWHYHPEYELTWVIRSQGVRFVGDSIQNYGPGDLVLLGPNLPHCWQNEADGLAPELIVAQFSRQSFGEGLLALPEARDLARLLAAASVGLSFSGPAVERVGELLRALMAQKGLARLARLIEILGVLAGTADACPLTTPDYLSGSEMNPVSRRRMELTHRYILENLDGDISQAEIAGAVGLSSPAFSRFFKATTGKTFVNFVNTLRVDQSCRMLQDPRHTITEIAMTCGYHNISNFNRQFLAIKGMNPTEYRQRFRTRQPAALQTRRASVRAV